MGEAGYSVSSDTTGEWYSGREVPRWVVFVWVAAALLGGGAGFAQPTSAPEISTGGPFSVAEGQTPVATLEATDDDTPKGELTWSIPSGVAGGADASAFTLTAAGLLAFTSAKDYETPDDTGGDGTYEVTVMVSDGSNSDTANLSVMLTNVAPTLSCPAAVDFSENSALRVATCAASDPPAGSVWQPSAWTLSGPDAALFSIDRPGGVLRFALPVVAGERFSRPPDYEAPGDSGGDNVYDVRVEVTDGVDAASRAVVVSVRDENEEGGVTFDSLRPEMGQVLTATVADVDGVDGAVAWEWERSAGRNVWVTVRTVAQGGASDRYVPAAADTGEYLRATAVYADRLAPGATAAAVVPNVVTGLMLTDLSVTTNTSRTLRPPFSPRILHYAIDCSEGDTMTLSPSAPAGARLAVDGRQLAGTTTTAVTVTEDTDVRLTVASAAGARTTYVVHCVAGFQARLATERDPRAAGVIEDLIMFSQGTKLIAIDNFGVPRLRREGGTGPTGPFFRFYRHGGAYRYSWWNGLDGGWFVSDADFQEVARAATVAPLTTTNGHDYRLLENGDHLLMAYERRLRDLSHLTGFLDANGEVVTFGNEVEVADSVIQIVSATGQARLTWNSFDYLPMEDCAQHRFPPDHPGYAHINSLQMAGGRIIASFRGCSSVLGIDARTGEVAWRLGRSNLNAQEWAERGIGPPPWAIVNDPEGEFCGQHAAHLAPGDRLTLYDNGVVCVEDPRTNKELVRQSDQYSRAVEYALDYVHGEAVFVRDHSLHGTRRAVGFASGHVEPLDNGDWLISWGRTVGNLPAVDQMFTQVDPQTGMEKLWVTNSTPFARASIIRALPLPPEALAEQPVALAATVLATPHTAVTHVGPADRPRVVVAFSQPVVDPAPGATSWPWFTVQGATAESVAPYQAAGAPANTFAVTLVPSGQAPITFTLMAGTACAAGGICTATGARLREVAAAVEIDFLPLPPPTGLRVTAGNGRLDLRWTAPAGATGYDVHYQTLAAPDGPATPAEDPTTGWVAVTRSGDTPSQPLTGLTNGTAYRVRVRAKNTSGHSAWVSDMGTPQSPSTGGGGGGGGGGGSGGGSGGGGGGGGGSPDRHGDTPAEATSLNPRRYTTGVIQRTIDAHLQSRRDVDYFTLDLPHAGLLTASTTGADTTGRLYQAQEDGQPLPVAEDTDSGRGTNFALGAAVEKGTYYLAVSAGRGSGAYRLRVHYSPAFFENPGPDSPQSGVSVLSGWVCEAETVEIEFETPGGAPQTWVPATGTSRRDTAVACGADTTDTGYGLLYNWNRLGDGEHTVRVIINDVVLAEREITVTTLGDHPEQEFRRGLSATSEVTDFPEAGQTTTLRWEQALQNFVIASGDGGGTGAQLTPDQAILGNPAPGSFQSGVSVLSGWVCEAEMVELVFETATGTTFTEEAGYGTERLDTEEVCGDTDNGFGLLFNWNRLGDGQHTVRALADGEEFGHSTFTVTTLGEEFRRGLRKTYEIEDFPAAGQTTTVEWQQGQQNFVITEVQ